MAQQQIKQAVDNQGKLLYLSKNKAKYIKVTDGTGSRLLKTGMTFLYWPDSHWYRLGDNNEIERKYKNAYDEFAKEIDAAIMQHRATVSSVPFDQQEKIKRDNAQKVAQAAATAEKSTVKEEPLKTGGTGPAAARPSAGTTPPPAPKKDANAAFRVTSTIPTGADKPKPVKKQSTTFAKAIASNREDAPEVKWGNLNEKETKQLYIYAFKWVKGTTQGVEKELKQSTEEDQREFIERFVFLGLLKRGQIRDDEIPPIELLKKLSPSAIEPDLLTYYERRLNVTKRKMEEKRDIKFKSGVKFGGKAMPTSFSAFAAIMRAPGMILGGVRLAAKAPGAISDSIRNLAAQASELKADVAAKGQAAGEWLGRRGSEVKQALTPSERDQNINKEMVNVLKALWDDIKKSREKKATVRPAEHKAELTEGKDVDIQEPVHGQPQAGSTIKAGAEEPKGKGIFGRILEWLSPLKKLRGIISGIRTAASLLGKTISGAGRLLGGLAQRVGGSILSGGARVLASGAARAGMMALGTVGAVAAAGYAGYQAGTYLNEKFGLSDKISDWMMSHTSAPEKTEDQKKQENQIEAKTKERMIAAGISPVVVEKWKFGDPLPQEYTNLKAKERAQSAAATQAAPNAAQVAPSPSKAEVVQDTVEPAPRAQATVIEATKAENDMLAQAKEDQRQQQIINAQRQTNTTVMQQSSGGNRIYPRTTNSTFQRFLSSRAIY